MYEVLEHWKKYQKERKKIKISKEFDEWLEKLSKKNGITKY